MSAVVEAEMVYCRACGKQLHRTARACPSCGATQLPPDASEKKIVVALVLLLILGWLGVHRFYVGKIGTGILQLLTLGGLGIWVLIDLILLVAGAFTDKSGKKLTEWT